jgi:hypothetical protein
MTTILDLTDKKFLNLKEILEEKTQLMSAQEIINEVIRDERTKRTIQH